MLDVIDAHYTNPKLAQIYDLDSGWSADREFYLSLADRPSMKILDLGCGTGLICNAYAEKGHDVTGADPASAMLAVAKRKPLGRKIQWIESSAQTFRSDDLYDLIIMTGHAFQVLLTKEDALSAFKTVRRQLNPDGRFVFESRNPSYNWEGTWNYELNLNIAEKIVKEKRELRSFQNNRMKFDLSYHFPDEILTSRSELQFFTIEEIECLAKESELVIEAVYGDWDRSAFCPESSQEMIFFIRS